MHLPTFGKSSTPAPPMPSKAAQVFGQEPRNPTKVVVYPIVPAVPYKTPTKAPRSETSKSLPVKGTGQDTYTRGRHSGSTSGRDRATSRRSAPRESKLSTDAEQVFSVPEINSSFESGPPPTPPAKDTPPDARVPTKPGSPLRRTAPSDRLRENYGSTGDVDTQLQLPTFAMSPSQPRNAGNDGKSPTKFLPCTADEYQKLIAGEPLPWASVTQEAPNLKPGSGHSVSGVGDGFKDQQNPMHDNGWVTESSYGNREGKRAAPLTSGASGPLYPPHPDDGFNEPPFVYGDQESRQYSLLQPRFYSPSDRSFRMYADGETPSRNVSSPSLFPQSLFPQSLFPSSLLPHHLSPAALSRLLPNLTLLTAYASASLPLLHRQ
jgi:hypothetical protein